MRATFDKDVCDHIAPMERTPKVKAHLVGHSIQAISPSETPGKQPRVPY